MKSISAADARSDFEAVLAKKIFEQLVARRLPVAGELGGEHVVTLGEAVEERVLGKQPAGAVQEEQRRSAPGLKYAALHAALCLNQVTLHNGSLPC